VGSIEFKAVLQARGPAGAIVLAADQAATVGQGRKRFPVVATVNGYEWRAAVAHMGGEFILGLNRRVRDSAGVAIGDEVDVVLALDLEPRTVDGARPPQG
jgi:hypothetical protein